MNTNFINYFEKYKLEKFRKFLILSFFLVLILLVLLNIIFYQNMFINNIDKAFGFNRCLNQSIAKELIVNTVVNVEKKEVSLFPEIKNMLCIGSIVDIQIDNTKNIFLFIGTSTIAFNYLLILLNAALCFFVLLFNKKKKYLFLFSFFVFNLLCNSIINPTFGEAVFRTFLPIFNPEGQINNVVFQNLFIALLAIKTKSKKALILALFYFIFLSIDFLGLFVVLYFVNSNLEIQFNKKEEIVLFFTPVVFYLSRVITSFLKLEIYIKELNLIDFLWINSGQRIFRGYRRYPDMEATLFGFKCNVSEQTIYSIRGTNLNCLDHYLRMGPSGEVITFTGNIELTTLIIMNVLLIFLIIFYLYFLNVFKKYKLILLVFILSPPLNFVTFLGNIDFMILIFLLLSLKFFSRNYYFQSLLLFLLSALKLHPIGGLIGLIAFSIYRKNRRLVYFSSILLGLFVYFVFIYQNSSGLELVYWSNVGLSYGLLNDSLVVSNFFNFNLIFSFFGLLFLSYLIYRKLDLKVYDFNHLSTKVMPVNFTFVFVFWFFETTLYTNNTYRLSIFTLLFFALFINCDKKVKFLIILSLFLEPTLLFENKIFELFIGIFNSLSLNILFIYLINCFLFSFTDFNSFTFKRIEKYKIQKYEKIN